MNEEMEMQEEPTGNENETKAEKFVRLGEYRMNKVVKAMGQLEHLSNRSSYEYSDEQVDMMFAHLEQKLADCRTKFGSPKSETKTFKFGENQEDTTMRPEVEIRDRKKEGNRKKAYAQGMVQILKSKKEKAGK